jgi:hypothetical protein
LGGIVAIVFFEKIYKRINFEQSESILEQFYQKKSKEYFEKRGSGLSEELEEEEDE